MSFTIKIRRGNRDNLPIASEENAGELRYTFDTNELYISNGLENKLVAADPSSKQDKLVPGLGITIDENNVINNTLVFDKLDDYLYTYEASFSDLSYEGAIKYFEENFHNRENNLTSIPYGACSSIRIGNFYGRNYDWYYNKNTTFVVHNRARQGRYESIGVAQSVLEGDNIDSGEWDEKLRLIPYLMLDGINEHSVFCNTNVVPTGDLGVTTGTHADLAGDYICQIMLPKYVLDHFTNATDAVDWIRDEAKIFAPRNAAIQLELHFMVGDPNHTYIVEFVHNEAVITEVTNSKQEIMTNFYKYDTTYDENGHIDFDSVTNYGAGLERYNLLVDAYDSIDSIVSMRNCMNLVQYTKAYTEIYSDPVAKIINPNTWKTEWAHDYSDSTILPHPMDLHANSPLSDYEYSGIFDVLYNMYQNRSRETSTTWQTVHSSVYDIERQELYLVAQESGKQYHFVYPHTSRILQNLDEEVERAKTAETILQENLTDEVNRAIEAERELEAKIDSAAGDLEKETEERIAADNILQGNIDAEISRATTAEEGLSQRITSNTTNISNINAELDTYGDIVTHNVSEFATAEQGSKADTALQPEDVINDVSHTETTKPLSANMGKELQDQIDNLKARGRYLSQWNAVTGLPSTSPTELPYQYKTGDYYIVGTVGEVNYKPTGTSYTGAASTTIETAELGIDDTYFFDGTVWHLQQNTQKTVTFANLAGQPEDNANLAAALNKKVDKTSDAKKIYGTDASGNQTTYDYDSFGKVDDVKVDGVSVVQNKIANIHNQIYSGSTQPTDEHVLIWIDTAE